ncbi:50S ribosome-binding GTPase [Tumebacillus sp. DT12]|uniref:50S ribosome-binding GTPase n=1 Tax=Tumebacillus lacus TaxID=2995335 RepID=A0ABT3WVT3_9BACL|nr:GTPase [Tumebacillus lacus]MCX7568790.1 50S ribosome-binding GTPase [Tumebacillus lacus]
MKNCLLVGRTNVGKTIFCINFAEYLGLTRMEVLFQLPDGTTRQRKYDMVKARHELSGGGIHKTRNLQSISLELPRGKGVREFKLTDSTGLADGIPTDLEMREAMAQTLEQLRQADCVLHMVDAPEIHRAGGLGKLGELDQQVAEIGQRKSGYLCLVNKTDLPEGQRGFRLLEKELKGVNLLPISALYRHGFREVKEHVWRLV